jgi:hypothetical protein
MTTKMIVNIDWDKIIACLPEDCDRMRGDNVLGREPDELGDEEKFHQREIEKELIAGKYHAGGVGWDNWYPRHFEDESFIAEFDRQVNCTAANVQISRVSPGMTVPKHWDVCFFNSMKPFNIDRYICFISEPEFGHVLVVKDKSFYNQPRNTLIKWDHYLDVHGAANFGAKPYYLFNYLGVVNE